MKIIDSIKKLLERRVIIKEVPMRYNPIGEIQSPTIAQYIMNKLIEDLEKAQEANLRNIFSADLNNKNSLKTIGWCEHNIYVLAVIRQYLEEYLIGGDNG